MSQGGSRPTPAVQMALRWLIGDGHADAVDQEVLTTYYSRHGLTRSKSARAAAGRMLRRLENLGYVARGGDVFNEVTRSGRRASNA